MLRTSRCLALPVLPLALVAAGCSSPPPDPAPVSPPTVRVSIDTPNPCQLLTDQERKDLKLSPGDSFDSSGNRSTTTRGGTHLCFWDLSTSMAADPKGKLTGVVVTLWDHPFDIVAEALADPSNPRPLPPGAPIQGHRTDRVKDTNLPEGTSCGLLVDFDAGHAVEVEPTYPDSLASPPFSVCGPLLYTVTSDMLDKLKGS